MSSRRSNIATTAATATVGGLMFGIAGIALGIGVAALARQEHPKEVLRNVMQRMNLPIPNELQPSTSSSTTQNESTTHTEYGSMNNPETQEDTPEKRLIRKRINELLTTDVDEIRERIERSGRIPYPVDLFSTSNSHSTVHIQRITIAKTIQTASFPFSTEICWQIFTFLTIPELTVLLRVSKAWSANALLVRSDQGYQRASARLGFPNGLTGILRGKCWQIVSGTDKVMQPLSNARRVYAELLNQVKRNPGHEINADSIAKDVTRTLNMLPAFTQPKDAINALSNVLNAYGVSDQEVGYTQGMNFVAGYLLTRMTEVEAFWTLHTLMCSPQYNWRQFYVPSLRGLLLCKYQFRELFREHIPELYTHFEMIDMPRDVFIEWFMTFFCVRKFPDGTLDCVWDWLLVDGVRAMHRVALAILHLSSAFLLTAEMEDAVSYIKMLPDDGILQANVLIPTALAFLVPQRWLDAMENQFDREFPEVSSSS